jgi:hypothetical protein
MRVSIVGPAFSACRRLDIPRDDQLLNKFEETSPCPSHKSSALSWRLSSFSQSASIARQSLHTLTGGRVGVVFNDTGRVATRLIQLRIRCTSKYGLSWASEAADRIGDASRGPPGLEKRKCATPKKT